MYNLIKNTLFVVSAHHYFKGDHIMFCKYCGNQIKDGSAFCPGCGKNQGKAAAATPPYTPPQQPIYGTPQPPMYGNPQPPYGGSGYYSHMPSAGYSDRRTFGWITAAVIAIFSIIFMIGQFSFKMIKIGDDHHTMKYSFGELVSDFSEDGMTLFITILSVLCIITSVAFLIVALVRAKNHPASCVRFAAASLLPTVVGRIGLIIEVIYLKNDFFGDWFHLSGSVIFSMIFCIILYVVSLVLASSVSN